MKKESRITMTKKEVPMRNKTILALLSLTLALLLAGCPIFQGGPREGGGYGDRDRDGSCCSMDDDD